MEHQFNAKLVQMLILFFLFAYLFNLIHSLMFYVVDLLQSSQGTLRLMVIHGLKILRLTGVEPVHMAPEAIALSIALQAHTI
jgi:hypothetical protein